MHKKYTIHEYQNLERSITINKAKGSIKLNLLTKETDDAFSTGTGIERAGFAGPVR